MAVFASIIDPFGKRTDFIVLEIPTVIGRTKKSKIVLNDDLCSSRHAQLYIKDNAVFVEDLESKNGTFLNDIRILKQKIYIGDNITLGASMLKLDDSKMSTLEIDLHTSESKRRSGSITIELETLEEVRSKTQMIQLSKGQKDFIKKSKLYAGVEKNKKRLKNPQKHARLESLAKIIDMLCTVFFASVPFMVLAVTSPELLALIKKDPYSITQKGVLPYTGLSLFIFWAFPKWNRGHLQTSIGEKILKLD